MQNTTLLFLIKKQAVEDALTRETQEEIGVNVKNKNFRNKKAILPEFSLSFFKRKAII